MPIIRPTSSTHPNQSEAFEESVSSVPMAMSMMVDSMVNMMQSNLKQHQHQELSPTSKSNEY